MSAKVLPIRKQKLRALLFRIESTFWRSFHKLCRAYPSSDPFVTGDGFRSLAEVRIDDGAFSDSIDVSHGRIIFIAGDVLGRIKTRFLFPQRPFVLISHNSDWGPDEEAMVWWKETVHPESRWFAQNCKVKDPSIIPIPIGIENKRFHSHGVVSDFVRLRQRLQAEKTPKLPHVLYGFAVNNNPTERQPALESLQKCAIARQLIRVNSRRYREVLAQSMAVASPAGNGLDTHRTWEAFYLRTVPIVTRSRLTDEWPHLPWMVIDRWQDVETLDEEALIDFYRSIDPDAWECPQLQMTYWRQRIIAASERLT